MKKLGLLLLVLCFVGCKKSEVVPTMNVPDYKTKTTEFSVTSDSLVFTIPYKDISGAKKITLKGKLSTSLVPETSSYVILSVGGFEVWHSSLMSSNVDFCSKDLKGLIRGSGIECRLEFYQISDVRGPFKCEGTIESSFSE